MEKRETKLLTPEIAGLQQPLQDIIDVLMPQLISQAYQVVICEGTSARIPGLIIENFFRHTQERRQLIVPNITYIDISTNPITSPQELRADLDQKQKLVDAVRDKKKSLVLTEFISSGRTIHYLGSLLEINNANFDVAAVYARYSQTHYREIGVLSPESLFISGYTYPEKDLIRYDNSRRDLAPPIYQPYFKPFSQMIFLPIEEIPEHMKERMSQIKHDVDVLSERLAG